VLAKEGRTPYETNPNFAAAALAISDWAIVLVDGAMWFSTDFSETGIAFCDYSSQPS
jgi:hypothetical protein